MKIEHLGFLVNKPISMGNWWIENLKFQLVRQLGNDDDGVSFISDDYGTVLEFAKINTEESINFNSLEPLKIHFAIECENPQLESKILIQNGATLIGESLRNDYLSEKILVRDPFGAVIQFVNRKNKL